MTNYKGENIYKIGDVAELLNVKPFVLRFWETEFPSVRPSKSQGGQRIYREQDLENFKVIKKLLYEERYSIEGARKKIQEQKKLTSFENETTELTPQRLAMLNRMLDEIDAVLQEND